MKFAACQGLVGELGFEEGLRKLKDSGYDGVELSGRPVIESPVVDSRARPLPDSELPVLCERAEEFGEKVKKSGLEIISFNPGYFTACFYEDGFYENYYRVAAALGAPNIKIAGTIYRPSRGAYRELFRENQRKMSVLTGFGARHGVRSLIELHFGYLNESCSGAYNILKDFPPELAGVIHDPQNMVVAGKENWRMGLEILGDYLAYVHFKNSIFKKTEEGKWKWELSALEEGLVDWAEFMKALKETGFSGYLCNEYRGDRKNVPMDFYLVDELNYLKQFAYN